MATYKFEQFNVEIINPSVDIIGVKDYMNGTCSVDVKLTTESASFGVNLSGFTYDNNTWEDADIIAWVNVKLQEYKL